jgi:hypothetical protein
MDCIAPIIEIVAIIMSRRQATEFSLSDLGSRSSVRSGICRDEVGWSGMKVFCGGEKEEEIGCLYLVAEYGLLKPC